MLVVMHSHQQNLTVLLKGDVQMVCIQKLTAELQTLGLWDTQVDGRYRYRYQLIPGAFTLTPEMRMQLQDIARFTQGALAASAALSKDLGERYQASVLSDGVQLTAKEAAFVKMLRASCGGYAFVPSNTAISPLVKVDLAWDGVRFQVVEIDTYNPRGLAYALWLRHAHVCAGERVALQHGLVYTLLSLVPTCGKLVWVYSERERYYAPVLEAAAQVLAAYGVSLQVVGESSVNSFCSVTGAGLLEPGDKLVIVPDRMHSNIPLREKLIAFALQYPERVLVPYVPHLGAKGLLAFLSNANNDPEIAAWQGAHLAPDTKVLADAYLPKTALLSKQFTKIELPAFAQESAGVLKAINSSGAKGVYMPGSEGYDNQLAFARRQKVPNYILQATVAQQQLELQHKEGTRGHYVRVTAYVSTAGSAPACVDAELTGTGDDPLVHGGPSCVQLPALF